MKNTDSLLPNVLRDASSSSSKSTSRPSHASLKSSKPNKSISKKAQKPNSSFQQSFAQREDEFVTSDDDYVPSGIESKFYFEENPASSVERLKSLRPRRGIFARRAVMKREASHFNDSPCELVQLEDDNFDIIETPKQKKRRQMIESGDREVDQFIYNSSPSTSMSNMKKKQLSTIQAENEEKARLMRLTEKQREFKGIEFENKEIVDLSLNESVNIKHGKVVKSLILDKSSDHNVKVHKSLPNLLKPHQAQKTQSMNNCTIESLDRLDRDAGGKISASRMSSNDNSNVTSFRWELVDMLKQRKDVNGRSLTSNIFLLRNRPSVQLDMFVDYSKGLRCQNTIRVVLKQFDGKSLEASVKLWIESTSGQRFNETFVGKHTFENVGGFCGYKEFDDDEYNSFSALYHNHETFYVCCEITDLRASIFPTINCEQEFIQDFWSLYEEEHYDAIVKVGGTEFKVMKAFLMAHSKVFRSMFTSNPKEGIKSKIDIKDIDENTMKHLIKWMYTSQLEENFPIEKLFVAADKYDIALLKKLCAQRMLAILNEENVFQCLIIASLNNYTQLKEASLNYVSGLEDFHLVDFLSSDKWHKFYNEAPAVANDVGKLICEKMNK